MPRTYVAIQDPVHNLLREITRRTPLGPRLGADGRMRLEYWVRPEALPDSYYALAAFHALQGWPLAAVRSGRWRLPAETRAALPEAVGYFDAARLDLRCCRDLRVKLGLGGPEMLSAELLTYGIGLLRARNDDPADRLHRHLWARHGRLHTSHETVYARIRALHRNSSRLRPEVGKESFDSTNVILGDALGELEQLWERRAETELLSQVAQSLGRMRAGSEIAALFQPPMALDAIMKLHFRAQGVWKVPPVGARALLRRIEFILERTMVDSSPQTVYQRRRARPEAGPPAARLASTTWDADGSGYDGWLQGTSQDDGDLAWE